MPEDVIADARRVLREQRVEALIIVGGDGSMTTALQLQEAGINCIGVPKTIDNDLEATAMTFGFDSAVATVTDALDRLHTTATSHKRVMVLEVMGRHAGWIALHGGIAGGADIILIPEIPFDYDKLAEAINARAKARQSVRSSSWWPKAPAREGRPDRDAAESEAANIASAELATSWRARSRPAPARKRAARVLGHLQRGGAPTTLDRILGTRFGVKAVQTGQRKATSARW